ncbi:GNAT family N-acetyltransferase [Gallaecimonas sp. GXIMD4217]|uniref:GNAT family N-acetyltransferase n=1 Tax=Gallaecimonas sp. GXIMD4217 TaxID=3131927 RepID=UPI00311B39B2
MTESPQSLLLPWAGQHWPVRHQWQERCLVLLDWPLPEQAPPLAVLDRLFAASGAEAIALDTALAGALVPLHLLQRQGSHHRLTRAAFYQLREPWLAPELLAIMPQEPTEAGHPRRPGDPGGVHYRRFIPELGETLGFRLVDIKEDGARFHRWQNDPRVARFWEYPWSRQALDQYLAERLADRHCTPLIGCFDDRPFGYFECYYVAEDRLAPHCQHGPFDQGLHCLVGEAGLLGRRRTLAWLNGLSHYLFLREPRSQQLFGEPRADNVAMRKYVTMTAWEDLGEFDFPHKRAALLRCSRDDFFKETLL